MSKFARIKLYVFWKEPEWIVRKINKYNSSLKIAISVLLLLVLLELVAILILNSSHFIFTMDDAYIQLRMAENLLSGHYGMNLSEPSSPSSSILWIFILAPFAKLSFSSYIILIINTLCAVGTLFLFWKVLTTIFKSESETKKRKIAVTWILILLIFATNLIALIFIGMEHSLQVFLVTMIICGLFYEIEQNKVEWWLITAVVIAPLIRYENFAISLLAIIYLFFRGYRKKAFISGGLIILLFGSFTIFLLNLNLSPLPTSVKFKLSTNSVSADEEPFNFFIDRFTEDPRALLLLIGMMFITYFSFFIKAAKEKKLLGYVTSFGILLHLLVGKYDSFNRYEIYIYTVAILVILYLYKENILKIVLENNIIKIGLFLSVLVVIIFNSYIKATILTPVGSNNIYEQQYQMHRFTVDYYKKPVAVNDLGFVAFGNANYVLDLWGLSSSDALKYRASETTSDWMDKISRDHNVKFAMIYDEWFEDIPANWIKLGELKLSKLKVTPSYSSVSFYALDNTAYTTTFILLNKFVRTLPSGCKFIFTKKE